LPLTVRNLIPAQAGIKKMSKNWAPAFSGVTVFLQVKFQEKILHSTATVPEEIALRFLADGVFFRALRSDLMARPPNGEPKGKWYWLLNLFSGWAL